MTTNQLKKLSLLARMTTAITYTLLVLKMDMVVYSAEMKTCEIYEKISIWS